MAKRYLWLLACGLLNLLAACGGGGGGGTGTPGFTLSLTPDSVKVAKGGSGQATVHVARRGGFSSVVKIAFKGAPSGISARPLAVASSASSGTLKVLVDKTVAAKPYTVTVHAQGGATESSATLYLTVTAATGGGGGGGGSGGASSSELIDKALANGKIGKETALIYKFYAAFGDSRLPAAYHGDDSKVLESGVEDELDTQLSSLSSQAQQTLSPFLIPPFYTGSWFDSQQHPTSGAGLRPESSPPCSPSNYKCAVSPKWTWVGDKNVKVWYLKGNAPDKQKAGDVVDAMENTIWPKLTGLMGHTPLSDGDKDTGGGDERLDITLTPLGSDYGETFRARDSFFDVGCEDKPVYILINDSLSGNDLLSTVAHEFMHAIQWSYEVKAGCVRDYGWLMESTAAWAQTYVYPKDSSFNHRFIKDFLNVPETSLEAAKKGNHAYGSHLFFLYLARKFSPSWISTIWAETQDVDNSLGAINAALEANSTSFTERWPEFERYNWNRDPETHYQQWDGIKAGASYGGKGTGPFKFALNGQPSREVTLSAEVPHLAAIYKYFSFPDSNARLVTFFNGTTFNLSKQERDGPLGGSIGKSYALRKVGEDDKKGATVEALVKIAGKDWEVQNWTDKPYISFCRDNPDEKLEQLVIIISNSEWQDTDYKLEPQGLTPTLFGSNAGCYQWQGTSNGQTTQEADEGEGVTVKSNTQNVLWERLPEDSPNFFAEDDGYLFTPYLVFQATQGSVAYTVSGSEYECKSSGSGTAPIEPYFHSGAGSAIGLLFVYPYSLSGPFARAYFGFGIVGVKYTNDPCGPNSPILGGPTSTLGDWFGAGSASASTPLPQLDSTGTVMKGSYSDPSDRGSFTYNFHSK
jgi:hypothetical protein